MQFRVALFGSFYRGYFVLDELLNGAHARSFSVVGVATDDTAAGFISLHKRVWRYPHSREEARMVEALAAARAIPVFKGQVKHRDFYSMYEHEWAPDICIAATFGQRFDGRLIACPRLGFYNIHPYDGGAWPSRYAGPQPFEGLIADGHTHARAALHRVDEQFDTGMLVARSPQVAIPPGATPLDMHKLTSPVFARFAVGELHRVATAAAPCAA